MNENGGIRVVHVIGSVCKGGVESVVFNYYKFIDRTKVQFDFVVDDDSPCEIPDEILNLGCRVYKIPPYTKLLAYIKALKKIFIENDYKIVHSHMNTLSVFTLYAAKKAGVPIRIAHNHSTAGKGEFKRNLVKYALRPFAKLYPTHLFACSEYSGRWLFGIKEFNKGKVTVFNNAIDTSLFLFNEDMRSKVRCDLGIEDKFVIGHVGRFMTQKNHSFLIDVFNEIHKRDKKSVLLLVGDGELRTQIEEKVKALNLQDYVVFTGSRNNVHELYQAMDVFVLPSLYEGLGMVAVEAQAAGLPCYISSKVPNEAILISKQYRTLPLGVSPKIWASSITKDLTIYQRESDTKTIVSQGYDIREVVKTLEEHYQMIINR